MPESVQSDVELILHTMATTAVENEKYWCDLDAVVGDGDFGYSLARGFEKVLEGWDDFDRSDPGTFVKKVAIVITSRVGGTSGPIWGTAMLRAGASIGDQHRAHGRRRDRRARGRGRGHQAARRRRPRREDAARRAACRRSTS